MEKEIEIKFELEGDRDKLLMNEDFAYSLRLIADSNGFKINGYKQIARGFTYFDTARFQIYYAGATIRKVEGFDPLKDKARMRFDIKLGTLENRTEESIWNNEEIDVNEKFGEHIKNLGIYEKVQPIIRTGTSDIKFNLEYDGTIIEASIDYVAVLNGPSFKELELELKKGNRKILEDIAKITEKTFSLKRGKKQKYSKILEMVHPEIIN
jgi:inorganic triphosphatase YgiF